jgi:hypothetical protein
MRFAIAVAAGLLSSTLAAESWKQVDLLPGDIAVELDENSMSEAMDGANMVLMATFRRLMPTGTMETDVAIDCKNETAKLRGLRLVNDGEVYNQPVSPTTDYHAIGYGSADAIYFLALCGKTIIVPPEVQEQLDRNAREAAEQAARDAVADAQDAQYAQSDEDFPPEDAAASEELAPEETGDQ